MSEKGSFEAKGALVAVALLLGGFLGIVLGGNILTKIGIAFLISIIYTFTAAHVIHFCECLKRWAFLDDVENWDYDRRLILGSVWSFTLIICIILYIFIGIINRSFK
jgi:hypothetical protein